MLFAVISQLFHSSGKDSETDHGLIIAVFRQKTMQPGPRKEAEIQGAELKGVRIDPAC